jgi:hypothetical protein
MGSKWLRKRKKTEGRTFLFWVFWAGVLYAGVAPEVISLFGGSTGASWLATWCGAFVAFMAKFDDLAEFSLGPLKAKMKETIVEVSATQQRERVAADWRKGICVIYYRIIDKLAGSKRKPLAGATSITHLQQCRFLSS